MDQQPHVRIIEADDVRIVAFQDRKILEEFTINQIGDELAVLVQSIEQPKILVDFEQVEHLSSAALGMLIKLQNLVAERKGKLKLSNISHPIYEVFKITKLNSFFDIHDTKDDALRSF